MAEVPHGHEPSRYHADRGCPHPDCLAARRADNARRKQLQRERHRGQLIEVFGRYISPRLALPTETENPARHGTLLGYQSGCDCHLCLKAGRRTGDTTPRRRPSNGHGHLIVWVAVVLVLGALIGVTFLAYPDTDGDGWLGGTGRVDATGWSAAR